MRRAVARGRMYPQSFSTDRRIGRLSMKALVIFPLIWVNADDQGRLCGDPEEVKYACFPNIDHVAKADVPDILIELSKNGLIKVYDTPKSTAIQLIDWWDVNQKMQWAWPSEYPPSNGWKDHLRYKKNAKEVVTSNWSGESSTEAQVIMPNVSGDSSPEKHTQIASKTNKEAPLSGHSLGNTNNKTSTITITRRGRGNSPEDSGESSGEESSTSPIADFEEYLSSYRYSFGKEPDSRDKAQLIDFHSAISIAGGATPKEVYDAFKEAAIMNKYSVSYARAVLFDWKHYPRENSP